MKQKKMYTGNDSNLVLYYKAQNLGDLQWVICPGDDPFRI